MKKFTQDEPDSPTVKHVTEIELPKENGEQNNGKENKLLMTNFEVKVENCKVEGLISYSFEQQIFQFKVNSGSNQELQGVYVDFKSNQNKWTMHGILQQMGFYPPTENPNVMMRGNIKTRSCEYISIYQDDLYIVSTTPEEIFHILQDKYKINIYLHIHIILVEQILVNSRNIWKSYIQILIYPFFELGIKHRPQIY